MNKGKQNNPIIIAHLLRDKTPFAAWRIPGEKVFHIVRQTRGEVTVLHDIEELNELQGFVIAPFRINEAHPIVLIRPSYLNDKMMLCDNEKVDLQAARELSLDTPAPTLCTDEYSKHFDTFIEALQNKEFKKLVLSRSTTIPCDDTLSVADMFYSACRKYIHSYIYLCYTPQTGIWLGSTPEVLLSGSQSEWNTVALAGTQPLHDGNLPEEWDDKNRREQDYVASYIRRQLLLNDICPTEKGPYPAYAGALSHLKTEFHFTLTAPSEVTLLLKSLHPTPAVCGLPKKKAYDFINDYEGYDRSYYSGFVGWFDTQRRTDMYVNLRCMHIDDNLLTLYAGGGILSSSVKEDEWQETDNKLQTMRRLIAQNS